jgi:hypothetical protein
VPQITSILANDQTADTSGGGGLTWQGWPACLTVIRVTAGLTLDRPAPPQAKDSRHRHRTTLDRPAPPQAKDSPHRHRTGVIQAFHRTGA